MWKKSGKGKLGVGGVTKRKLCKDCKFAAYWPEASITYKHFIKIKGRLLQFLTGFFKTKC